MEILQLRYFFFESAKNVIYDDNYGNERVNQKISKVSYYQSI